MASDVCRSVGIAVAICKLKRIATRVDKK